MRTKEKFKFRAGTWDEAAFNEVYVQNEYRLPDQFQEGAVVLDIGGHIGCFSLAAIDRGAQIVLAVEPEHENFKLFTEHCAEFIANGRLIAVEAAAVRSDGHAGKTVLFDGYPFQNGLINTAAGNTITGKGVPVQAIPFDDLVDRVLGVSGASQVTFAKVDCEGAEWEILYTSQRLERINEIVGEYHKAVEISSPEIVPNIVNLLSFLKTKGFANVEYKQSGTWPQGLFRAKRSTTPY